ncbi:hypothetical protein ACQ4PT_035104 [Festuca glaucescens]
MLGGALTLLNPATGEYLPVPPPFADRRYTSVDIEWGDTYSFAYHPITGRYKVVQVPCSYKDCGREFEFDAVRVLTLGETMWREVPCGAKCKLAAGIVSADGTTYWVTVTKDGAARIVSFDLMDERIISATVPAPVRCDHYWLSEVRGRLGFVTWQDVWVLEEGRRWSHRYSFTEGIPRRHFVYGEYVLTCNWLSFYVRRHRPPSSGRRNQVVRVDNEDNGSTLVAKMPREHGRVKRQVRDIRLC